LALAHNGNLTNIGDLLQELAKHPETGIQATTDTEVMSSLIHFAMRRI
jgi:glutamine phosphoribosylpyrophosphate amidotransferase